MLRGWPVVLVVGLCASAATWAEPDAEGCMDIFLTRLKGFRIEQCEEKKFDSYTFAEGTDKQSRVESQIVDTWYRWSRALQVVGRRSQWPTAGPRTVERRTEESSW